ncbi:MAG TPA: hypothetical protein VGK36_24885 [Candidatus Angelobacter sp.]|jgi:hypothetical protein
MKKLFTIACTLVLGGALAFAQATQNPPASGDQSQTGTSTTTKKHSKHSGKKSSKKHKKGADTTATPAPAASPSPK